MADLEISIANKLATHWVYDAPPPTLPHPKKALGSASWSKTTLIKVGPELTPYTIHTDRLTEVSEYFRICLNRLGLWVEQVITFDDIEPRVFTIFVNWLYSRKLPNEWYEWTDPDGNHDGMDPSKATHFDYNNFQMVQVKCIILGNRLLMPDFEMAVHNSIAAWLFQKHFAPYPHAIRLSHDLPDSNPLMDLFVDVYVHFDVVNYVQPYGGDDNQMSFSKARARDPLVMDVDYGYASQLFLAMRSERRLEVKDDPELKVIKVSDYYRTRDT